MVRIPSPSGQEERVARRMVDEMQRLGFDAEMDGAGNAVGHLGQGSPHIILLGHMDTVPGEIPVRREGNLLYGRGSVDAKGPLAAFVMAAARIAPPTNAKVTVIGAVEEEAATSKGAYYAVERYRPDYVIIGEPSRWNRITLGYKGRLLVDYSLEQPMAHTAGEGRGACEEAVAFWQEIARWAAEYNQDKPNRFATLDPSLRAIHSSQDGLAERVEMHIGLRLPLELDLDALTGPMLDDWRGQAEVTMHGYEEPFRAEKRNLLTSAFLWAIREEGDKAAFVNKTGTSDMNVVGPRWRCPIVAYGPGDSSLDHTPDEHIDLDEYLQSIRVLTKVLGRLAES
ncbi:MAG: hypothetical protein A2Y73_04570 [Chloroflexi bacterium RBG_13_56_8]|nr:MAG: hypothetical protein A2Y73_04570 [Chloroflexi bacterium RBG_13_56_8]